MTDRQLGSKISGAAEKMPIIAVTGLRQSGKSTRYAVAVDSATLSESYLPQLRKY